MEKGIRHLVNGKNDKHDKNGKHDKHDKHDKNGRTADIKLFGKNYPMWFIIRGLEHPANYPSVQKMIDKNGVLDVDSIDENVLRDIVNRYDPGKLRFGNRQETAQNTDDEKNVIVGVKDGVKEETKTEKVENIVKSYKSAVEKLNSTTKNIEKNILAEEKKIKEMEEEIKKLKSKVANWKLDLENIEKLKEPTKIQTQSTDTKPTTKTLAEKIRQ